MGTLVGERTIGLTTLALSFLGSGYWVIPVTVFACLILFRTGRHTDALAVGLSIIGASALSTTSCWSADHVRQLNTWKS